MRDEKSLRGRITSPPVSSLPPPPGQLCPRKIATVSDVTVYKLGKVAQPAVLCPPVLVYTCIMRVYVVRAASSLFVTTQSIYLLTVLFYFSIINYF